MPSEQLTNCTYQCVHFVSSFSSIPKADLEGRGYHIAEITIGEAGKEQLLNELAAALRFPAYFGHNWDALEECLKDLSWLPAQGYIVWLKDSTRLWQLQTSVAGTLVEIVLGAAEWWARKRIPFHLVFVGRVQHLLEK